MSDVEKRTPEKGAMIMILAVLFCLALIVVGVIRLQPLISKSVTNNDSYDVYARRTQTDMAVLNSQLELWKAKSTDNTASPGNDYAAATQTLIDEGMIMAAPQPPAGWKYTYTGGRDGQFKASRIIIQPALPAAG